MAVKDKELILEDQRVDMGLQVQTALKMTSHVIDLEEGCEKLSSKVSQHQITRHLASGGTRVVDLAPHIDIQDKILNLQPLLLWLGLAFALLTPLLLEGKTSYFPLYWLFNRIGKTVEASLKLEYSKLTILATQKWLMWARKEKNSYFPKYW